MSSPIDKVTFIEAESPTIEKLIDEAIRKGASKDSIDLFLKVLFDNQCAIVDGWDTYLTD